MRFAYFNCLPLLVIWTSLKSNLSMVNWLADCRFDLHYRIVWRVWRNSAKTKTSYNSVSFVHVPSAVMPS